MTSPCLSNNSRECHFTHIRFKALPKCYSIIWFWFTECSFSKRFNFFLVQKGFWSEYMRAKLCACVCVYTYIHANMGKFLNQIHVQLLYFRDHGLANNYCNFYNFHTVLITLMPASLWRQHHTCTRFFFIIFNTIKLMTSIPNNCQFVKVWKYNNESFVTK